MIGSAAGQRPWMSDMVLTVDAVTLHNGTIWDHLSK